MDIKVAVFKVSEKSSNTKSQGQWPFLPENKIFKGFLPYMVLVALSFEIYSHCLIRTYQVRIMTLASTVFKKSTLKKKSHLNALGSKFDLDMK